MPKISVIVPVYNVAPYLARCLDSLRNQTLQDIEIICIDDKSTDISLEILREYARKDTRIHVIAKKKNSGVSAARNAGIDAAHGEYIGFVDSDDFIDKDFYEKLYNTAHKNDVDMARCGYKETLVNGKTTVYDGIVYDVQQNGKWFCMHQAWCAIYRTKMLKIHKIKFPTDIKYAEDLMFLTFCVAAANNVIAITGIYYHYMRRNDSLDAPNLSLEKISDLITSCKAIAHVYNTSNNISYNDYVTCYATVITRLKMHFNRTTSAQCQQKLCIAMVDLYKECHAQLSVASMLSEFNRQSLKSLIKYDIPSLYSFLHDEIAKRKDTFYLFGCIPLCHVTKNSERFILDIFGIQLLKIKPISTDFRLWIMYIPIIRRKRKFKRS